MYSVGSMYSVRSISNGSGMGIYSWSGGNNGPLDNWCSSIGGYERFADDVGSVLVTDGGRHGNSWGGDHGWGGDGRVTQETTRFSCDDGNESGQHHQFEHFDCFRSVLRV
jgi:hypothetical protein